MTALAATDYSDVPLWSLTQWALILGALAFAAACWVVWAYRRAPITEPETSAWDAKDGVRSCAMNRCHARGTIARRTVPEVGGEDVRVCPGCSDLGELKGWWAS